MFRKQNARYENNGHFFMFYLLKTFAKIQIMITITKITIKIPTPIPALKMSPTNSQLVNENSMNNTINNLVILFCMILGFKFRNKITTSNSKMCYTIFAKSFMIWIIRKFRFSQLRWCEFRHLLLWDNLLQTILQSQNYFQED